MWAKIDSTMYLLRSSRPRVEAAFFGTNEGHDTVGVEYVSSIADALFAGDAILELAEQLVWTKQFGG